MKYTEQIEKLPSRVRFSIAGGGPMETSTLARELEELDKSQPTLDSVADALRHGEARRAHVELLWMVVNGKDIGGNARVGDIDTPLIVYAADTGAEDVAYALIDLGADVNAVDSRGYSALYLTTSKFIAKRLREAGAVEKFTEDLVKVDQKKVVSVKMDRFERMALCDMAVRALECHNDYRMALKSISAWYLLDYMLESGKPFSFMGFVYALANSELEQADNFNTDEDLEARIGELKGSGYTAIPIDPESVHQFKRLSFNDPRLCHTVDMQYVAGHPFDADGLPLKDLVPGGKMWLCINEESLEPVDPSTLERAEWGLITVGYGGPTL